MINYVCTTFQGAKKQKKNISFLESLNFSKPHEITWNLDTRVAFEHFKSVLDTSCAREQIILQSEVISYGELTRASPQGEELMYMWKRTFSRSLKQESLCRTKIDCSQSSFLLLQSDHRPQAGRKKKEGRHEKQPRLKVFSAHIPG